MLSALVLPRSHQHLSASSALQIFSLILCSSLALSDTLSSCWSRCLSFSTGAITTEVTLSHTHKYFQTRKKLKLSPVTFRAAFYLQTERSCPYLTQNQTNISVFIAVESPGIKYWTKGVLLSIFFWNHILKKSFLCIPPQTGLNSNSAKRLTYN